MLETLLLCEEVVLAISFTYTYSSSSFHVLHFSVTIKSLKVRVFICSPGPSDERCWHVMHGMKEEVFLEGLMTLVSTGSQSSLQLCSD